MSGASGRLVRCGGAVSPGGLRLPLRMFHCSHFPRDASVGLCPCARHSWLGFLSPAAGGWWSTPGRCLALAPAALTGLLWYLAHRTWSAYESQQPISRDPEPEDDSGNGSLSRPGFWYGPTGGSAACRAPRRGPADGRRDDRRAHGGPRPRPRRPPGPRHGGPAPAHHPARLVHRSRPGRLPPGPHRAPARHPRPAPILGHSDHQADPAFDEERRRLPARLRPDLPAPRHGQPDVPASEADTGPEPPGGSGSQGSAGRSSA